MATFARCDSARIDGTPLAVIAIRVASTTPENGVAYALVCRAGIVSGTDIPILTCRLDGRIDASDGGIATICRTDVGIIAV